MLIDLSVSLNESTPVYPGDPETKITTAGILDQNGYQDHLVCMGTHVGTHMDAPSHMIAGGKNLNEFELSRFSGRGIHIPVESTFDIEALKQAGLLEGDIVLFDTRLSDKYYSPEYFTNYPAMSEDIAQYLIDSRVSVVGVDACSVDNQEGFPIHKKLLGSNILIVENLTNLSLLEGKQFKVYAFPIKLEIDGAPVRVVAETL
jgi:arylformamidase